MDGFRSAYESLGSPFRLSSRSMLPADYEPPPFPSLGWPPTDLTRSLDNLKDIWRFTLFWTLMIYTAFHLGAAAVALVMQVGRNKSNWKYLWMVPLFYLVVAVVEALLAGTLVGLIVGGVYIAGQYPMSTWIPFFWGWVNVLVLIISSFSIQGGL